MQDIFDFNARANDAVVGAERSESAMGFPNPNAAAGLRVPSKELLRSRDQLNAAQATLSVAKPQQSNDPVVGFDPNTGSVYSGGKTFDINSNLDAIGAYKTGLLDVDNSQAPLPANYRPTRASQIKGFIERIPDWQKELQSGVKSYAGNLALLGSAVTGSDALRDTYLQKKGEADLLASASKAPGSFDEVKFGENFLPYVRRLGLGSIPYLAEAMVSGGFGGIALRGVGTQAAKAALESQINRQAQQLLARSTVGGVAGMSEAQAVEQAARAVGRTLGSGAGVVAGTYPSAAGDILGGQMEQAGKTDLGSAALLAVPYAGLNLLGLEGAAGGVGRALDRGLGATAIGARTGRAAASAATTVGGEMINEAGQEVLSQAGRMQVDPLESLFSPAALARYKEAAIGGGVLGLVGGGASAGRAAFTPAEARVTPQLMDANQQAQLARYETEYARDQLPQEMAVGTGGEQFQGPTPGAAPAPAPAKTAVVDDPTALSVLGVTKLTKRQRDFVTTVQAAGLQMDDPALVDAVNALAGGKEKKAKNALTKVIADRAAAAVPTGGAAVDAAPGPAGVGGQLGVDAAGSGPAAGLAPDVAERPGDGGGAAGAVPAGEQNLAVGDTQPEPVQPLKPRVVRRVKPAEVTDVVAKETPAVMEEAPVAPPAPAKPKVAVVKRKLVLEKPTADAAATQWDAVRGGLPAFAELNPQQQTEARDLYAAGKLNKGELRKQSVAAAAAEKTRTLSVRKQVEQKQAAERAARGAEGNEDTDAMRGILERTFGIQKGAVMHSVLVMGKTYAETALEHKVDKSAIGKVVSPQLSAAEKDKPAARRRLLGAKVTEALAAGKINQAEADKLKALIARGVNARTRRDQAAELVSGVSSIVNEDTTPSDQAAADEAERRADENKGEDEKVGATVYADESGAITTEDLESSGMSIETGISSADPDVNTRASADELAALKRSDPQRWASTQTARALDLLEKADEMEFKLAKVEKTKRPAQEARIAEARAEAAELQQQVVATLQQARKNQTLARDEKRKAGKGSDPKTVWTRLRNEDRDIPAYGRLSDEQKQEWADAVTAGASDGELRSEMESMAGDATPEVYLRTDEPITGVKIPDYGRMDYDAFEASQPGMQIAMSNLEDLGLSHIVDMVHEWQVVDEPGLKFAGAVTSDSRGQYTLTLNKAFMRDARYAAETITHELTHVFDAISQGGAYSTQPELALSIGPRGVRPAGAVATELMDLYETGPDAVRKHFAYPLDHSRHQLDAETTQGELLAQAMSIYTDDNGRAWLQENAPATYKFLSEVTAHVQTVDAQKTHSATDVFERWDDFLDRAEADGDAVRGGAERGRPEAVAGQTTAEKAGQVSLAVPGTSITAKLPAPLQRTTSDIGTVLSGAVKGTLSHLTFTEDIIARAKAAGVSAAEKYAEVRQRRIAKVGERERAANKVLEPFKALSQAQQVLANDFIYDSTRENKWGFTPGWLKAAKVDQAMAQRFRALEPATREFVRSVFKHGYDVMQDKQKLVRDNVGVELDGDIAKAKASGNTALAKKLQSTKDALLARFGTLFALSGQGPYAPLRRTGDWLVVAKSNEYRKAEEANDSKALGELETDPDHYFVSFAESELAAARMARDLEADGFPAGNVVHRPKEAALDELYGGNGMMGAFLKIKTQLEGLSDVSHSVAEKEQLVKLQRVVTTMYLNALAEGSARKAELRRKGIAGKIDMVSGFSHQAVADAQFMASIEFNPQILKAISAMRKQAKEGSGQADKMRLYNELMLRHVESSDVKENRLAERTARLTSLWMLATSPAYMLTNLTQTFVLSLPYMSRQHGYTPAANAILKSYKDVGALLQGTGVSGQIDFDKVPADVRRAIKELVELGRIDIGLDSEMGSFKVEEKGAASRAWNAVDNGLRLVIQKIESVNRLSAAMASYRLELARTGSHEKAVAYASRVITQSHGDYSRANAPRIFNSGLGRVALQFRKFQLIQLTYIAKLLKDSLSGPDQWAARKALGFTLMHMGVLGGLVAMPGFAALGALAAALGGDEGPDDAEEMLRKKIGNQAISDLLLRGGPAALGVDLSSKIGMGNIMSILPFTNVDLSDRKSVQEIGYNLALGATGGLILRGSDAVRYMTTGDYYRGLESAMPSGIMNLMKAARFKTEGVTNSKGDLLQTRDETALMDTFYQALGFTPTTTARRQATQANAYDVSSYFKERQALLRNQYTGAISSGRSPARIIEDWRDMQDAMRERGMAPATLGTLFKAPAEQRKREANTAGGVQFTRKNRQMVEEAATE